MSDSDRTAELLERIQQLESDNASLERECEELRETQGALEQALCDSGQKQLKADLLSMELTQIFASVVDPMWVVREDGLVVRVNQAMLTFLGRPKEEVLGRPCADHFDGHCCPPGECPVKTCKRPKTFHEFEIERQLPDGEIGHFLVTTSSLSTLDGRAGFLAQFKDITPRKRAEALMAQANAELERLARVDGLTGVANRRTFDETLAREWARLAREKRPLAVILCDIDHFKAYNDHYGHQAGDDCLRQVARQLADSALRPADLVARYGGEEFVFLLPNTELAGAVEVAERARQGVAGLGVPHRASSMAGVVTLSLGVSVGVPSPDQAPDGLILRADEGLYRAKRAGRNQVAAYVDPEPPPEAPSPIASTGE